MSKGNLFLGLNRGKVGDAVFFRAMGQQRTRALVVPKNPRSRAQMAQRTKMANVSALYRAGKSVLSRSFEVRGKYESSFNAFARAALANPAYLTKEMVQACLAVPQAVQASRGTLPSIEWPVLAGTSLPRFDTGLDTQNSSVPWGEFSQSIIEKYPSISNGDSITFLQLDFVPNNQVGINDAYNVVSHVLEVVIDVDSTAEWGELGFITSQGSNESGVIEPTFGGSSDFWNAGDSPAVMRAIIHSRKDGNGKLLVSSQYFGLSANGKKLADDFSDNAAIEAAVLSYGYAPDSPLA